MYELNLRIVLLPMTLDDLERDCASKKCHICNV